MKKILTASALALTIACGSVFAATAPTAKQQAPESSGMSSVPTDKMSYFWFENLPKDTSFKLTSGGKDVTGNMDSSAVTWYTTLKKGTYLVELNDGSQACSFAVNYSNDSSGNHTLTIQDVHASTGYTCQVTQSGGYNPLVEISKN